MYYQLGGVEQWCSTSNPQGSCKPLSGVCKPMDSSALSLFKGLQGQLNRIAHVKGWSKIDVDGRIGSATLSLYNRAMGTSLTSCDQLSERALSLTQGVADVMAKANSLGAPTTVPAPWTSRPSTIAADGSIKDPPALAITDTIFGMVSSPFGLLIAAGLGYGAYRMAKGGKKTATPRRRAAGSRARRRKPSRRRVRRTVRRRRR